jgi:hypothetical protein
VARGKQGHGGIPEHFEPGSARPAGPAWARPAPGPPTNLTGRTWAEILKPANCFGPSRPEMLFLVVLRYKICGRPGQAQARPEPGPKIEALHAHRMVMGRIFLSEITEFFSARPEPGPARKMLRST